MVNFWSTLLSSDNLTTIYFVAIIFFIGIIFFIITLVQRKHYLINKNIIDSFPSILTTLGVLGTFVGITLGLLAFDPLNIDESIGKLLSGLRIAFLTSIAGMLSSVMLGFVINRISDVRTKELADISRQLAKLEGDKNNQNLLDILQNIEKNNMELLNAINCQTESNKKLIELFKREINLAIKGQNKDIESISSMIDNYNKSFLELSQLISNMKDDFNNEKTVLNKKIDNFSFILSENNSKALVNVMTEATEKFASSMDEIISKLVQENFDKLNNSVEQMIQWQQDNKEAMNSLVLEYLEMQNNFAETSTILKNVGINVTELISNTDKIVSDNSILAKLIKELQSAMMDDTNFGNLTNQLCLAVNNIKDASSLIKNTNETLNSSIENLTNSATEALIKNSESTNTLLLKSEDSFIKAIDDAINTGEEKLTSTVYNINKLCNYINDLSSSITVLINDLKEISKIKDINSDFWNSLNDGLQIIKNASGELSNNLNNINELYYNELSNALRSLDECIRSAMIQNN